MYYYIYIYKLHILVVTMTYTQRMIHTQQSSGFLLVGYTDITQQKMVVMIPPRPTPAKKLQVVSFLEANQG